MAELVVVRVSLQIAWGLLSSRLAKGLKTGSPSDETLRQLLLDKFQKLHEELNSLRRKELVASVSFMENGYELFLKDPVESKKEFSKARDAAQMAFGVVSEPADKLLATKILLASAMHEFDDKIETAVSLCLKYVSRLNSLPEIADACKVYLQKGVSGRFKSIGSGNRKEILKVLSEVNRNVWEYVKQNVPEFDEGKWPSVHCNINGRRLNPACELIPVRECQEVTNTKTRTPVAMVVNGKKLFLACSEPGSSDSPNKNEIEVLNMETSNVQFLSGHSAVVLALVSVSGKVFSGSYDRSILAWDVASLSLIQKVGEHDGAIRSLVANKSTLFSGGTDKVIRAWDIETLGAVAVLYGHEFPISLLAFTHHLFSYAPGECIRIWNVKTWNVISMVSDPGNVSLMYCSLRSKLFLHCGMNVKVCNLGNGKEEAVLKNIGKVSARLPGMKIFGTMGDNIYQYDLSSSKCLYNEALRCNKDVDISLLYYNHDLGLLFLGGNVKENREGIVLCL